MDGGFDLAREFQLLGRPGADIGFRRASRGEERFVAVEEFPSQAAPAASRKALQPRLLVVGALDLGPARGACLRDGGRSGKRGRKQGRERGKQLRRTAHLGPSFTSAAPVIVACEVAGPRARRRSLAPGRACAGFPHVQLRAVSELNSTPRYKLEHAVMKVRQPQNMLLAKPSPKRGVLCRPYRKAAERPQVAAEARYRRYSTTRRFMAR